MMPAGLLAEPPFLSDGWPQLCGPIRLPLVGEMAAARGGLGRKL